MYSIRADARDFVDGFCIVRAVESQPNAFTGTYFEKAVDQTVESKVLFVETKIVGQFSYETIVSVLMSAISSDSNVISIDKMEYEEILYPANIDS